jgi:hypothetical protein
MQKGGRGIRSRRADRARGGPEENYSENLSDGESCPLDRRH